MVERNRPYRQGSGPRCSRLIAALVTFAIAPIVAIGQNLDSSMLGEWILIYGDSRGGEDRVGVASLERRGSDALIVTWIVDGQEARGVGFLREGVLWLARGWGRNPGTCIYDIGTNGVTGVWSLIGSEGLSGDETWRSGEIDAEFSRFIVAGTNPDGSSYEGTLTTRRFASVYTVQWMVGTMTYHGVGIRDGGRLVVAWCVDGTVDVARYAPDGSGWSGVSATLGRTDMRMERLLRASDVSPGGGR